MFKQVFRLTFITFVWKKYKRAIVSTALLFAYLWLVGSIHTDYLDYARLEDESNIGSSFLIKWSALIGGTVIYLVFNFWRRNKPKPIDKMAKEVPDENDPFAEIRSRKKLRSKAEMIIDPDKD